MAEPATKIEQVLSRAAFEGNNQMWGKMYVDREGKTIGGWLVDSWTVGGAAKDHWRPQMHWLNRATGKLHIFQLKVGMHGGNFTTGPEDMNIDPRRAEFIQTNTKKWEQEWWQAGVNWDW
jgi:hypothetical protein